MPASSIAFAIERRSLLGRVVGVMAIFRQLREDARCVRRKMLASETDASFLRNLKLWLSRRE
jgi:hypothetical protein